MSCCNNKKYVDTSCVKTNEWDDVNNLLGVTDCGTVVKVKKPIHELDDQDRDKLDAVTISGAGDKVLTDDGSYKGLAAMGAVMNGENEIVNIQSKNHIEVTARQNISISTDQGRRASVKELEVTDSEVTFKGEPLLKSSDIEDVVVYDENDNIQTRKNIILKNGGSINGITSEGNSFRMVTMSADDQMEVGSTSVESVIKSDTRPYVKTRDGQENRVAYVADVEATNKDLSDLSQRVDSVEGELNSKIDGVQADLDRFKEETVAGFEEAGNSSVNLQKQIDAVNSRVDETDEAVAGLAEYVEELDADTEKALEEVGEKLDDLRRDVTKNGVDIDQNSQRIDQLREDFNNEDHFKGYYEQNSDIQIIKGKEGDYAWSAQTGTIWIYDGNSWVDSDIPVPDQTVKASEALPLADEGLGSAGTSNQYARGDHSHPTDLSRAAVTDLDNYLNLTGNSKETQMKGDIWLGSEQKIRVSDSGESYVGYVTDKQETQLVGAGIGGINLVSATGSIKANGEEVAVKSDVQEVADNLSGLKNDYEGFEKEATDGLDSLKEEAGRQEAKISGIGSEVENLTGRMDKAEGEIDGLSEGVESLKTTTEEAFEAVDSTLSTIRGLVDGNSNQIEVNTTDISQLRQDFTNEEKFKGYFETSAEIQIIAGTDGAYAWSAETGTVWIYDGNSWVNSGTPVPDQTVIASNSLPLVDDEASAGISTDYARGDHRHPTDKTRAAVTDLDNYLKLEGNSQATPMSGDIWLGSEQKLRVSDSGESYVVYNTDKQEAQVISAGIGGVNLISTTGSIKANGEEIAVKGEVQEVADNLSSLQADYDAWEESAANRLATLEEATREQGEAIAGHDLKLTEHTGQINDNSRKIAKLEREVEEADLFKGYFATTADITSLQGVRGAFAWNGESGTVWVYNADLLTWQDSLQPIPTEGAAPYEEEPAMDGTASAGTSSQYARGNHVHPTDISRAAATDLKALAEKADATEGTVEGIRTDITGIKQTVSELSDKIDSSTETINQRIDTEVDSITTRIDGLETEQGKYVPLSGNPASPMSGDLRLANDVAVKYNTSENAKIYFNEDNARLNIESPTIGGINIQTEDASLTWNSDQLATEKYVAGNYYNQQEVDGLLSPVNRDVEQLRSDLDNLDTDYQEFKSSANSSLEKIKEEEAHVKERLETAEGLIEAQATEIGSAKQQIEGNRSDIDDLLLTTAEQATKLSGLDEDYQAFKTSVNGSLEKIEEEGADVKERLETAEGSIEAQATEIGSAKGRISINEQKIEDIADKVGTHDSKLSALEGRVSTAEGTIQSHEEDIRSNSSAIETLEQRADLHKGKITELRQTVSSQDTAIAQNTLDINSIQDDLSKKQYFKGYFITYLEIQQLEGENGAYAWCGETGTVWVYNSETPSWEDSEREIPQGANNPYDGLPFMDYDLGSAGIESRYSRGDHRHPTDITRAAKAEVDDLKERVNDTEEAIGALEGASGDHSDELTELKRRVGVAESDIQGLKEADEEFDTKLAEVKTQVETNKEDIEGLKEADEEFDTKLAGVKTQVETNKEDIEGLKEADEEFDTKLAQVKTQVETNKQDIEGLKEADEEFDTKLAQVKTQVETNKEDIEGLKEADEEFDTKLAGVKTQVETNKQDIEGLKEADEEFDTKLAGVKTQVETNKEDIEGLKEADEEFDTKLAQVKTQVETNKQDIEGLKEADEEFDTKLAEVKTQVETNKQDIEGLKEADEEFDTKLAQVKTQVETNKGDIEGLKEADEEFDTKLAQVKTQVETNKGDIEGLKEADEEFDTKLAGVKTQVETNKEDIEGLKEADEEFDTKLAQVKTQVETNKQDIEGLEEKTSGLDTSIGDINIQLNANLPQIEVNKNNISSLQTDLEAAQDSIRILQETIGTLNERLEARLNGYDYNEEEA